MFGHSATFGLVEAPYPAEWHSVGDASYWRRFSCNERGWPLRVLRSHGRKAVAVRVAPRHEPERFAGGRGTRHGRLSQVPGIPGRPD